MDKVELIENIRELNSTATVEFLSQFTEQELLDYVEHLLETPTTQLTAAMPSAPPN